MVDGLFNFDQRCGRDPASFRVAFPSVIEATGQQFSKRQAAASITTRWPFSQRGTAKNPPPAEASQAKAQGLGDLLDARWRHVSRRGPARGLLKRKHHRGSGIQSPRAEIAFPSSSALERLKHGQPHHTPRPPLNPVRVVRTQIGKRLAKRLRRTQLHDPGQWHRTLRGCGKRPAIMTASRSAPNDAQLARPFQRGCLAANGADNFLLIDGALAQPETSCRSRCIARCCETAKRLQVNCGEEQSAMTHF